MKKFLLAVTLFLTLDSRALSQSTITQSETKGHVGFGVSAGDTTTPNVDRVFGLWSDFAYDLGDHVSVNALGQFNRIKLNSVNTPLHNLGGRGDLRFSPFKIKGFHLFGSGGLDFNRISGFGSGQNFVSPTLGGGVGYGQWMTVHYFRSFPDMVSPANLYANTIRGETRLPLNSARWALPIGVEYRRFGAQNAAALGGQFNASFVQFSVGLSRSF